MPVLICTRLSNPRRSRHGPVPAVGVQPGDHQRRAAAHAGGPGRSPPRPARRAGSPPPARGPGPPGPRRRSARRAAQVERRAALAHGGLGQQRGHLGEAGRVDAQHVRAVGGQEAGALRAGDDPGQVEHPDALEGAVGGGRGDRGPEPPVSASAHGHQRGAAGGLPGRRCHPGLAAALGRGRAALGHDRGLDVVGAAGGHRRGHGVALGRRRPGRGPPRRGGGRSWCAAAPTRRAWGSRPRPGPTPVGAPSRAG